MTCDETVVNIPNVVEIKPINTLVLVLVLIGVCF